jgi:hypothetical protein
MLLTYDFVEVLRPHPLRKRSRGARRSLSAKKSIIGSQAALAAYFFFCGLNSARLFLFHASGTFLSSSGRSLPYEIVLSLSGDNAERYKILLYGLCAPCAQS